MRRFICLWLIVMHTFIPVMAQDEPSEPINILPDLLALTPYTEIAQNYFSFVDYDAVTTARQGAIRPLNSDALYSNFAPYEHWWRALMGVSSGLPGDYVMMWMEDDENTNGVSYFDMNASLVYGNIPEQVTMILADYDPQSVIGVHQERDYTLTQEANYSLLCSADGCDAGNMMSVISRDPRYIFGGKLGREQPILLFDDVLVSSPYLALVEDHMALLDGELGHLGENMDYRAIAEAVTMGGVEIVMQGDIMPASAIQMALPDDQDYSYANDFPDYSLLAIVDGATTEEQVARIMLVYDNEADAELASAEIPQRLEHYQPLYGRRTILEIFEVAEAELDVYVLAPEGVDRYITVVELRTAIPLKLRSDEGDNVDSSTLYRIWIQTVLGGDALWLLPSLSS